jgi:hypothetical protein
LEEYSDLKSMEVTGGLEDVKVVLVYFMETYGGVEV